MGFPVNLSEVAGYEEFPVGQLNQVLNLVVEGEPLAVPLPRRRIEAGEARRGNLLSILALLHAGKITAHVHG